MKSKIHNIQNCACVGADRVCMSFCQFTGCIRTGKQSKHQAKEETCMRLYRRMIPKLPLALQYICRTLELKERNYVTLRIECRCHSFVPSALKYKLSSLCVLQKPIFCTAFLFTLSCS